MANREREHEGERMSGRLAEEDVLGSAPPDRAIRPPEEWGDCEDGPGRSELNFTLKEADRYQRGKERRAD